MNKIGRTRKSMLLGGSAMMLVLFASSVAQAQCTGATTTGGGGIAGGLDFGPLAAGGAASVNSLVSVLNTANTAFLTQGNAFIGSPPNPQPNQTGGGIWTRGIGGRVDTDSVGLVTFGANPLFGIPAGAQITCNTTTRTNFGGYQAGVDIAKLNFGGVNIHGGATVGYVEADAKDISPGGTFSGNFQIPFAGVYGALTWGGFFLDGQVRAEYYAANLSDPDNGLFGQNLNARGTTFSSNMGYNQSFGSWFLEPSVGVIWSRINTDRLNVSGTLILANSPGLAPPSSIQIDEVESVLGRASVRVGTNFTTGNLALQPFATASVFHEFSGDVFTTASTNFASIGFGGIPDITATLSSTRVGTYGQFALGIAGQVLNTGWLGYVRGDYRTGENIEGWSVNGGVRYQFTPDQIAAAAGKGIFKAPAAPVAAPYNWTGLYVGGYAGTTWGHDDWTFVVPPVFSRTHPEFAGVLAGGQVGFNYQMGNVVVGAEADLGWTNAKGARSCPNLFFFTCQGQMDWLTTATARVGYAWDRVLVYGKGGFAAARVTEETVWNPDSQPVLVFLTGLPPTPPTQSASRTPTGFTLGAGFEFGLTPNWSAKAEYMYYDLGTNAYTFTANTFTTTANIKETGNLVRVGLNYRFVAAAPVLAKY